MAIPGRYGGDRSCDPVVFSECESEKKKAVGTVCILFSLPQQKNLGKSPHFTCSACTQCLFVFFFFFFHTFQSSTFVSFLVRSTLAQYSGNSE